MNGQDIVLGMNYVETKFVEEAEAVTALTHSKKAVFLRRPILIAAIIAMLLLLVGCTVLYISSIQELWLGEEELFYDRHDPETLEYLGRHYYTVQVFSVTGTDDSPAYQAAQEWFAFTQYYDPDGAIRKSVWGNEPEFPEEYTSYNIYTQDMKVKLDEIVQKYDLKLAGKTLEFQNVFEVCNALGLEQSVVDHPDVLMTVQTANCLENGNFYMSARFSFRETLDAELISTWGNLKWNRKDCFSDDVIAFEDTGDWTEWYYTTTTGSKVLIVRSPSASRCYMIFNRKEAVMSLELETRYYQDWDNDANSLYLSDQQVEQIADVIDFAVNPQSVN